MPFRHGSSGSIGLDTQALGRTRTTWTRRQAQTLLLAFVATALAAVLSVSLVDTASAARRPVVATVHGIELIALHTQGTFSGYTDGGLTGDWLATVDHTPLTPNAHITGGSFTLSSGANQQHEPLNARISNGAIRITNPGANCSNQTYKVTGNLTHLNPYRSGTFSLTLTHWRHTLLGSCLSYFATTTGTLTLTR
jgi:hypothetical protein